jgi:outer membrane lipoprotein-sorting protein
MSKIVIIFFLLNLFTPVFSSPKEDIILKIKNTNNLSFNFIQTIDEKNENGVCVIKYPKKIYCKYNNVNKKIVVSNGKSLVIKNKNQGSYYIYPLDKTPLNLLLDKDFLVSKISVLKPREVEDKYINFTIFEKNNKINIFFDKKNFSLVGWQIMDIYQNLTITFISSIKVNQQIDDEIFILPKYE